VKTEAPQGVLGWWSFLSVRPKDLQGKSSIATADAFKEASGLH